MARLIDLDEAIKQINHDYDSLYWNTDKADHAAGVELAISAIESLDTIEAEPVKHGKWVIAKDKDEFAMWDACSSCGHGLHYVCEGKRFPYCPNCGARMDGE